MSIAIYYSYNPSSSSSLLFCLLIALAASPIQSITMDLTDYTTLLHALTIYLPHPYYLLLCRSCKVVVLLSQFHHHFTAPACHNYTYSACKKLKAAFQAQEEGDRRLSIQTNEDLTAWRPPGYPIASAPIPHLPIYYNGLQCCLINHATQEPCRAIYRGIGNIQQHCREKHKWVNPRQIGGRPPPHPLPMPWDTNIPCQKLQGRGYGAALFPIVRLGWKSRGLDWEWDKEAG